MINLNQKKEKINAIVEAVKKGDDESIQTAVENFHDSIYEGIKADFAEFQATSDKQVLVQRGYRQLTTEEEKFYNKVIEAIKSGDAKQALVTSMPDGAMPSTIIQDIYKEMVKDHPILAAIEFRYVGYLTQWIISDTTSQKAVWGKVTDEIVKEISAGLKEIDVKQNKLSAYAFIQNGLVEMGATFLDAYVREYLTEAVALGLEASSITGNGVNQPVGMNRDIHEGVTFNTTTGYPEKKAVELKSFMPKDYGVILSKLAKTEKGNARKFDRVMLICNMTDYLTKIMPSSTILNSNGTFTNNVFPFATDVEISTEVPEGKAIIGLPKEYNMFAGSSTDGVIEVSEEYKFVEDMTTFKIKQYAAGRAYDDTCFVVADISKLEPLYIATKAVAEVANTSDLTA